MCPRRQKARLTDGLRWAPDRRPRGLTVTSSPVAPRIRPVSSSRTDCPGSATVTGLPGAKSRKSPDSPPRSKMPVPANSDPHSAQCQPPRACVPGAGPDRAGGAAGGCGRCSSAIMEFTGNGRAERAEKPGDQLVQFYADLGDRRVAVAGKVGARAVDDELGVPVGVRADLGAQRGMEHNPRAVMKHPLSYDVISHEVLGAFPPRRGARHYRGDISLPVDHEAQ